jgi:hypothetical protein
MKRLNKPAPTFIITPRKKIRVIICLASFFILLMHGSASAQKKAGINELLQELFIGETVYAQEKSEIQMTVKPAYWNQKEGTKLKNFPLQVEYGITDRFQVDVELPYVFHNLKDEQATGNSGNIELGFLYNILKGNKPFAFSVAMSAGFPTVRKGKEINETGETEVEWQPTLIVARQVGKLQVHASVGAEITTSRSELQYNLAGVMPMGDWRATLEVNARTGDEKITYLTPGVIWTGLDDFEFGLGVSKSRAEWGVTLMAVYEFSLNKGMKLRR